MNNKEKKPSYLSSLINSASDEKLQPRSPETNHQNENISFLIIDALASVNGDIDTTGDVVIDGVFKGRVNARNLKITKNGQVTGLVKVKIAEISGVCEPEIECSERLTISETGRIKGKIICNRLEVKLGASFIGSIEEYSPAISNVKN